MPVWSGNEIAVDGETSVRGFKIKYGGRIPGVTASGYTYGTGRTKPVTDWSGQYFGYGYQPANMPRSRFTLTASIDGVKGVTGAAYATKVIIRGSIEKGGQIEYIVEFKADGALTLGAAAAEDTDAPEIYDATASNIATGTDGTNWAYRPCIRDWVIEITAKDKPYSASCTPRVTKRTMGAIDARVLWRYYLENIDVINELTPAHATNERYVRVYVTSELFYQFDSCRIMEIDDFGGDHEGDENVAGAMMAEWNITKDGSELGQILLPDTTNLMATTTSTTTTSSTTTTFTP